MSEQHGQLSGAQWTTKSATASTAGSAASAGGTTASPSLQKNQLPNPNSNSIFEDPTTVSTNPYGLCGVPLPNPVPDIPTFTGGRFQAPPIRMQTAKSLPLTIAPIVATPQVLSQSQVSPTRSNVPVPSGFVPPPFPNVNVTGSAVSGTTSVLTPNPFATATGNASLAFVNAFNSAQQLELGKIMHAMNANTTTGTATFATALPRHPPPPHPPHTHPSEVGPTAAAPAASSGGINSTIAENVMHALTSDEERMRRVQQVIEASLDDTAKLQIAQILETVAALKPIEKLFLYLRLPGESTDSDPLRQPQNPLGTRSEINHTINWVRSHLEHDAQVSIPKQDVYNDYITYCERLSIKPLSTADFGKVMKQVFPGVRPRRLGTRGNSRYCYAAMRKTMKLTPPQLPQLCKEEPLDPPISTEAAAVQIKQSPKVALHAFGPSSDNDSNWDVVRTWAEKLLNSKLGSMADLATRIKNNNATVNSTVVPKKYTPREPKEKRILADMGPLKKRRKKKRKGSTSSESSCNRLCAAQDAGSSQEAVSDESKTEQLLKIKQEIIDSPSGYLAAQLQQQPMNLATEPRSNAVRNLTPKILEMPAATEAQQPPSPTGLVIKDEAEEYNTTNIFCKKVLKAQQTKGFWANSPSSGSTTGNTLLVPPVITTTAATPPPIVPPVVDNTPANITTLSMGPPAQLSHPSSVSPSSSLDTNSATPKVASRNMMLLRAKRLMAENAAAIAAAAEDTGLAENLGLPRERVISICNMDKHELDDYFLPDEIEEENSEGPDTELLQYFQMGDAEENQPNSLDAQAEQHRNPQAVSAIAITNTMAISTAKSAKVTATAIEPKTTEHQLQPQQEQQQSQQQELQLQQMRRPMPLSTPPAASATTATAVAAVTANIVGSASASLALMSQKHQQQNQQQQQPQQLHQQQLQIFSNNNSNKRKISLSNASSNGNNKNCIFLPISPNINHKSNPAFAAAPTGDTATTPITATTTAGKLTTQNCFASPGVTRMRQRSNLLTKQQSLDFGSNNGNGDPMIGAHRRRRSYVYSYPSSTSASAPPSPSLLQQCMGGNWSIVGSTDNKSQFMENNVNTSSSNVDILVNQNSMDLETSLALSGANMELNETQRSQSVPLSHLQRSSNHSPSASYNRQVNQPVIAGVLNESLFSENSNSQQSLSALKLSTGDVDVSTGLLYEEVDVNTLISPSFNNKFGGTQTTTKCGSSAGSSSGYSSAGSAGGILSRSVPSTPLPHQQFLSCNSGLSNTNGNSNTPSSFFNISPSFNCGGSNAAYGGQSFSARNALDISKSMPTTPITTPCFRYSPIEQHRDFLINGNTIDSLPSPAVAAFGVGSATDAVLSLNTDTLIDDGAPNSSDVEAIIDAADILDSL